MTSLAGSSLGFIGLGLMGKPMVRGLMAAGAAVCGHNRSRAVVEELARQGMRPAASPRQVAENADSVILMVVDTDAVEAVLTGEDGVIAGLRPGALVIDMGTTQVTSTYAFAEAVKAAGGDYMDAPVSGGQVAAEAGNLTIMAGGGAEAWTRAKPVLDVLGLNITHVGDIGGGQVSKTANQMIVGLTIGAVAEALVMAQRAGVDPQRVRQALMGGFAASRILELHGQRMVDESYAPGARATVQLKDMRQAAEFARSMGLDLPALELSRELFTGMVERGLGDLDHSGLIEEIKARQKG